MQLPDGHDDRRIGLRWKGMVPGRHAPCNLDIDLGVPILGPIDSLMNPPNPLGSGIWLREAERLQAAIESPEVRRERGKPEKGTVRIGARQEGDRIVIEVEDDGGGVDPDKVKRYSGGQVYVFK